MSKDIRGKIWFDDICSHDAQDLEANREAGSPGN